MCQVAREVPKRIYKGKRGHFGLSVELDACEHAWIKEEKFNIYKVVDSFTEKVIVIHTKKEETGKGYLSILREILTNNRKYLIKYFKYFISKL